MLPQAQAEERAVPEQLEEAEPGEEVFALESSATDEPYKEMVSALLKDDLKGGEEAYKRVQEAEIDANKRLRNKAFYLYLRYGSGDTGAIERLQSLAAQANLPPELVPTVRNYIGMSYEQGDDFLRASEAYEAAAEVAQTEEGRASLVVSAARCLFAAGNRDEAFSKVMAEIDRESTRKALSTLYAGLGSLYERAQNLELRAIALEKAIEYNRTTHSYDLVLHTPTMRTI